MHANKTIVAPGSTRDFGNRYSRRIGSKNSVGGADIIELFKDSVLDLKIFKYCLDD